jgi:LEA14-like dessication related protein
MKCSSIYVLKMVVIYTAVVLMLKHHNPNPCIIVVTKDYKVEMDNDH